MARGVEIDNMFSARLVSLIGESLAMAIIPMTFLFLLTRLMPI